MTTIVSDAYMEAFENMERAGVRYERILILHQRVNVVRTPSVWPAWPIVPSSMQQEMEEASR